ncbi:aminotransferase class V-fold PLP-dependent enzyme, partial [bacterium]|nr:aminotransferase class V-fold PLP-dependent enzyme [bacterium]
INLNHILPADVGTILDVDYSIATRTGLQCAPLVHEGIGTDPKGTVRFSMGYFNTIEEVDKVLQAVKELSKMKF